MKQQVDTVHVVCQQWGTVVLTRLHAGRLEQVRPADQMVISTQASSLHSQYSSSRAGGPTHAHIMPS
jgi:hypothetical protein